MPKRCTCKYRILHYPLLLIKSTCFPDLNAFGEMRAISLFSVSLQSLNIGDFRPLWLSFPTAGPVATAHLVQPGSHSGLTSPYA